MEKATLQVDQIYKNMVEDFNPAIKNFVTASKAHVKSLYEASNTTKAYLDSLSTLCGSFQKGFPDLFSKEGKFPILIEDCKCLALQQMEDLKTKYLDFLLPLEINMDKDWKILQAEHKKYISLQKARQETTAKVGNVLKKHKRGRSGGRSTFGKNIKKFQVLEEERELLETFLGKSIETVSRHEQQRYMFIYHYLQSMVKFHISCEQKNIEKLSHYAQESLESGNAAETEVEAASTILSMKESIYSTLPGRHCSSKDGFTARRSQSLDNVINGDDKSNLVARSTSFAVPDKKCLNRSKGNKACKPKIAKALRHYEESNPKLLNFREKDEILLTGEPERGWQFGMNQRTGERGWFPLCYIKSKQNTGHSFRKKDALNTRMSRYNQEKEISSKCSHRDQRCRELKEQDGNFDEAISESSETLRGSKHSSCSTSDQSAPTCCRSRRSLSLDSSRRLDSSHCSCEESSCTNELGDPFCCDASLSPSLCRSLTSPDLPPCFKRSVSSSKNSCKCSIDSGFNNDLSEENLAKRDEAVTSNSKWIASFYEDFDSSAKRNQPQEESSPTFLNYLYPEGAENDSIGYKMENCKCSSRESWLSTAFRSLGKAKKQNILSACSRKIASQKAKRKKEPLPQGKLSERSSSLLCLDITSCSRSPDDIYATNTNYEDIIYYAHNDLKDKSFPPPPPPRGDAPKNLKSSSSSSDSNDASVDPYFIVSDHKFRTQSKFARERLPPPPPNDSAPPLPPRKPHRELSSINIFNYKDYLSQRLFNNGYRLDQRSYTTGNQCGPWYDLWDQQAKGSTVWSNN